MKIFGIEILSSPALETGQMLARSGGLTYAWDYSNGVDCCVVARRLPDGRFEIIDITHSDGTPDAAPSVPSEEKK